jgi:hypothetical protein
MGAYVRRPRRLLEFDQSARVTTIACAAGHQNNNATYFSRIVISEAANFGHFMHE